jgi:hypothetical protein
MRVGDLFYVQYGINMELDACEKTSDADGINFVARTSENNGVVAKVKPVAGKKPQPAGVVTCAGSGSVLSSFVQYKPFYSGRDLYVLTPKRDMRLEEKMFYCLCIKMNAFRYGYGRQANKTLKDIPLPPLPDWLKHYNIDYSPTVTKIPHRDLPIATDQWKKFKLSDFFQQERGKRLTREHRIEGTLPLATAGFANEGIAGHIANEDMKIYRDVLTIDMFCNCFYRGYEFACDDNILVLDPLFSGANRFNLLFLATVVSADKYRYAYGRQYRQKDFREHIIQLPTDENGQPDWKFMEHYVKSLRYSDRI